LWKNQKGGAFLFRFLKSIKKETYGKVAAIVVAAGNGSRMGGEIPKQFMELAGRPVLAHTLRALQDTPSVSEIITVTKEQDILMVYDLLKEYEITKGTAVVPGGETRQQSVKCGLKIASGADFILIHDGARPCVLPQQVERTIAAAAQFGGAVLGCPVTDTLKQVNQQGMVVGTVDRSSLWQAQTPQVFRADVIRAAYENPQREDTTDDCALVEQMGAAVVMVEGTSDNIKITTPADLAIAEAILCGEEIT
jgi:2-C-methyl-D-erythritol 4-phosphate cytidylyltransferase